MFRRKGGYDSDYRKKQIKPGSSDHPPGELEHFSTIFLTIKATYGQNSRGQIFTVFIATKVFYHSISRLQEAGNKIQNQGTQV